MITDEVIKTIYKSNKKPNKQVIASQLEHMIEVLRDTHEITKNDERLIMEDLEEYSPFRVILIDRINGIEEFEDTMALILPNCILFFSKESPDVHIHIKMPKMSFKDKVKSLFTNNQ